MQTLQEQKNSELVASKQIRPLRVCMHVLVPLGIDVRVEREASALVERGYQVTVVDLAGADTKPFVPLTADVQVRHVPMSRNFHTTRFTRWKLWRGLTMLGRGVLGLLNVPADVYHAHDFNALPATYLAACLRRKPLVFDAHELPLSDPALKARWARTLFKAMLKHIVPRCAAVISVSPPILQALEQEYGARHTFLVRNIPRHQQVQHNEQIRQFLNLSPDRKIFLYQGYLSKDRGLDLLVEAARYLDPKAVIVLMGPTRPDVPLHDWIATAGVADRVKVIPPVSYADLLSWTASADVGLCVMRPDFSYNIRWCLPNKFFEYIMAGLPILAAPLEALSPLVKEHQLGYVVNELTPQGLAGAMNAMLAHPAELAEMHQRALALAQNEYCWEQERASLYKLYAQFG